MAVLKKRTTRLLAGLAVVFVIVLIILCLVPPSGGPPYGHQTGKSAGTLPEDIITGTPDTTAETSTSTTTQSTSSSTESTSTSTTLPSVIVESHSTESTSITTESSTSTSTLAFDDEDETTLSDYDSQGANDTDVEEDSDILDSTTDLWISSSSSTSTSTTQVSSSTTDATIIESSTNATDDSSSTTDDSIWVVYNATEELETTPTTEEEADTTSETSSVTTTAYHYDEVHNETSTEIYSLFNETTSDFSEEPELTTTTVLDEETTLVSKEDETTTEHGHTTTTTIYEEETTTTTSVPEEETTLQTTTTDVTTAVTKTVVDHQSAVPENETEPAECTHPDCKELAARMLDMMDHRADPCQDFYQYACGGVEDDPFLHPEDPAQEVYVKLLGTLQEPSSPDEPSFDPARQLYKTCIEHSSTPTPEMVDKLREQVNKYGVLDPRVLGGDPELAKLYEFIDEDTFDLQEVVADFIKMDYPLFFDVGVDVDKRDNQKFSVRLSLPLDGFNSGLSESIDTTYCTDQHQRAMDEAIKTHTHIDLNDEYEQLQQCRIRGLGQAHLVNRLQEAAQALNLTQHVTDPALRERLVGETALDTEFLLQDIKETWPEPSEVRYMVINKNFTEYTTEQLDNEDILTNLVNWGSLLQKVVGRRVFKVQVYHEADIRSVMKNVEQIAKDRAPSLRNMLLMLWGARLYTDILAPEGRGAPGSPQYCVSTVQYLLPDVAAEIFLKSFSVVELEAMGRQVTRVVNSVKKTVSAALQHRPGVSEELRDKLQRTFTQIGAAEYLQDLSEDVARSTDDLFLEDSYVENVLTLLRRRRTRLYSVVDGLSSDPAALWNHFSVPYSVTATTLYSSNSILIPEGIMSPPYMHPHLRHLPDYIAFSGIGHVVAHEFLHAIDTTGIKFDGLIGEELRRPPAMDEREYCMLAMLKSNFSLQVRNSTTVSFRLPQELHINELMVDSEATRLAWLSYVHGDSVDEGMPLEVVTDRPMRRRRSPGVSTESQEPPLPWLGMSPHQIFLLRTAQTQCATTSHQDIEAIMEREHLPARLRVNLALVHEPLFAAAFNCPAESKMAAQYTCPYIIGHMNSPQH